MCLYQLGFTVGNVYFVDSTSTTTTALSSSTREAKTQTRSGFTSPSSQTPTGTEKRPPLVEIPITISHIWMPGTYQIETTTQFTSGGILTTSTITSRIPTSYLAGIPAVMATPFPVTLTNSLGVAIATTYTYPHAVPVMTSTLSTLRDASGTPTATVWTKAPPTSQVRTFNNDKGIPTATKTFFPVIPQIPGAAPADDIVLIANKPRPLYFTIYFLPVLITAMLLMAVQAIDAEIKLLMPYRLLSRHSGLGGGDTVEASEVLCLRTRGFPARLAGLRVLIRHGDALSVLSELLNLSATALVALSGEAVGMKLRGSCLRQNVSTCLITVTAFPEPARAAQALLAVMLVLVATLAWVLVRWKSGVAAHPASLATICSLLQVPSTAQFLKRVSARESARERLQRSMVRIGFAENDKAAENYGLVFVRAGSALLARIPTDAQAPATGQQPNLKLHVPVVERATQAVFLFFLCGLLTVILYYENTVYDDPSQSPFEAFMDSQEFGVVALFTAFGALLTFAWEHVNGGMWPLFGIFVCSTTDLSQIWRKLASIFACRNGRNLP